MSRYLLPAALFWIVLFIGNEASAHHRMPRSSGNPAMRAANGNMGYGPNGFGNAGFGNVYGMGYGMYPAAVPMVYPGMGYAFPGNIYTQSYFNSPAYGHWNGFGK